MGRRGRNPHREHHVTRLPGRQQLPVTCNSGVYEEEVKGYKAGKVIRMETTDGLYYRATAQRTTSKASSKEDALCRKFKQKLPPKSEIVIYKTTAQIRFP